jgi:hypothetical protein
VSPPSPSNPPRSIDAWSAFARARKLRDSAPTPGLVERRVRVLEGVLDDVPIVVDICMESSLDRFVPHTRVTGRILAPVGTQIAILTRHELVEPPRGELLSVGDREFDGRFYVKANPIGPAFTVLRDQLRATLLGFPHALMFTYERDAARLFWEGLESEPATLDLATEAVLAACTFRPAAAYR